MCICKLGSYESVECLEHWIKNGFFCYHLNPYMYRHCVLYFQPPFFTLIDFCDQSTVIIFSDYVVFLMFISKKWATFLVLCIICKNRTVISFVFPWMSYLYLIWREISSFSIVQRFYCLVFILWGFFSSRGISDRNCQRFN